MKPIPAIIQPAPIDVDQIADQITMALNLESSLDAKIEKLDGQLGAARSAKHERRVEIGKLLLQVRPTWPVSGPKAKGWGAFLARVRMDDSTAHRYMEDAKGKPRVTNDSSQNERNLDPETTPDLSGDADSQIDEPIESQARELAERDADDGTDLAPPGEAPAAKPANVNGGSGEPERGTYCTPRHIAQAVGAWDLDPFSNPRSHIIAGETCQLERRDDGLLDLSIPGSYYIDGQGQSQATHETRVWIQPPYDLVLEAIQHYGHTRFCALLRFDTSTAWFRALLPLTSVICFPRDRVEFEAPPGLKQAESPYPHALYYASEDDVTDEVRATCFMLRVDYRPE